MDWSLDANREWLRKQAEGHEEELAGVCARTGCLVHDFVLSIGRGQYTYKGFIDWMAEAYPAELYEILLEMEREEAIPEELGRRSREMLAWDMDELKGPTLRPVDIGFHKED